MDKRQQQQHRRRRCRRRLSIPRIYEKNNFLSLYFVSQI
jgi:hypothetical protein